VFGECVVQIGLFNIKGLMRMYDKVKANAVTIHDYCLPGGDALYSDTKSETFWRNLLKPTSQQRMKRNGTSETNQKTAIFTFLGLEQ
jgi:hypothetical protein